MLLASTCAPQRKRRSRARPAASGGVRRAGSNASLSAPPRSGTPPLHLSRALLWPQKEIAAKSCPVPRTDPSRYSPLPPAGPVAFEAQRALCPPPAAPFPLPSTPAEASLFQRRQRAPRRPPARSRVVSEKASDRPCSPAAEGPPLAQTTCLSAEAAAESPQWTARPFCSARERAECAQEQVRPVGLPVFDATCLLPSPSPRPRRASNTLAGQIGHTIWVRKAVRRAGLCCNMVRFLS